MVYMLSFSPSCWGWHLPGSHCPLILQRMDLFSSMQNSIMEFSRGVSHEQGRRPRANSSKPITVLLSLHTLMPTALHVITSTMPYHSTSCARPLSLMCATTPQHSQLPLFFLPPFSFFTTSNTHFPHYLEFQCKRGPMHVAVLAALHFYSSPPYLHYFIPVKTHHHAHCQ